MSTFAWAMLMMFGGGVLLTFLIDSDEKVNDNKFMIVGVMITFSLFGGLFEAVRTIIF